MITTKLNQAVSPALGKKKLLVVLSTLFWPLTLEPPAMAFTQQRAQVNFLFQPWQ